MKKIHREKKPHKRSICDYATAQKTYLKVNSVHETPNTANDSTKTPTPRLNKPAITIYLESNPDVKCDPEVTHCQRPKDLNQSSSEKATFIKRGPRRSSLKLNLQNKDKENAVGKALKVQKIQAVETNKRQKLIKNAIEKHGRQTGNEKLEKETKKITLNARGKPSSQSIRRNYVKVINIFIS